MTSLESRLVPEPRIRLRPITRADEPDVFAYASHELIAATTNVPHPYPRDAANPFICEAIRKAEFGEAFVFAVVADERFVGLVSINRQPSLSINFGIAVLFLEQGIRHCRPVRGNCLRERRAACDTHRKFLSARKCCIKARDAEERL